MGKKIKITRLDGVEQYIDKASVRGIYGREFLSDSPSPIAGSEVHLRNEGIIQSRESPSVLNARLNGQEIATKTITSTDEKTTTKLIAELEQAKKAVQDCLNRDGVLVDMHGLAYWAKVVEEKRKEIKERL